MPRVSRKSLNRRLDGLELDARRNLAEKGKKGTERAYWNATVTLVDTLRSHVKDAFNGAS